LKVDILISLQPQSKHDKCVYLSLYSQVDFTKDTFHELVKNKQPTFTEACPCQFGDKVLKFQKLYTLSNLCYYFNYLNITGYEHMCEYINSQDT